VTTPLPVSGLTPYITPELLTQLPTGISWSSLVPGRGVQPAQLLAAQANLCAIATTMVDGYCKQPLRATIDPIELTGPGRPRVSVPRDRGRPALLTMKRWPVLSVVSVQVSLNKFPRAWSTVPAGLYAPATPVTGLYGSVAPPAAGEGGQGISLAPGFINWLYGRDGWAVLVEYVNGWPHAGLAADATPVTSGAQTITVDDCTGWAITSAVGGAAGATGTVYDAAAQEVIHVTAASADSGPGDLTLASPLAYDHPAGVMVSSLPQTVVMAAAWFASSIALTRGATATSNREIPASGSSTAGPEKPETLAAKGEGLLDVFMRII
jgi:hypothetical protein